MTRDDYIDCGDNSCRYAPKRGGMRTNGGCRCDDCPSCGQTLNLPLKTHRPDCETPEWVPPSRRGDRAGRPL